MMSHYLAHQVMITFLVNTLKHCYGCIKAAIPLSKILIDATYKKTKYDIPPFFLSVKTNVVYIVVAEFRESAEEIGEAISILKEWNPNWNPAFYEQLFKS